MLSNGHIPSLRRAYNYHDSLQVHFIEWIVHYECHPSFNYDADRTSLNYDVDVSALFHLNMIASVGTAARNASNKEFIKKVVGLIVVVVVCVAVVVIVLKVLNKFGDSSDDEAKEETNFEGKPVS